ncbi:MAG: hypothetical protein HY272_12030, partial [Gammaproteobacteria bacterium]|nr:hypothetical protein [Gammaproteobacteria bacterium]
NAYTAKIGITYYKQKIACHYASLIQGSLEQECRLAEIECGFEHFGVIVRFESPVEVLLYDDALTINRGLCDIIARVGPVILRNVYLTSAVRSEGHRNRFPHLRFHIDRNPLQPTRYSMYTRDPYDAEQRYPRTASTLFTANIVSHLQGIKEGDVVRGIDKGVRASAPLFEKEDMSGVISNIVLEQRWDEPESTGEIAMIDNATALHASYYRDIVQKGYRIGVRYLAGI